jgi:hypothetical protein
MCLLTVPHTLTIAGDIPDDKGPQVMRDWLEIRYGKDNRWDLERDLKTLQMVAFEPKPFLASVDNYIARIKLPVAMFVATSFFSNLSLTLQTFLLSILVVTFSPKP